jgi:hypothetical protein
VIGETEMDWFIVLLGITIIIRGLGAGMIYDVAIISLPVRQQIGAIEYTRFAKANFKSGVKTYAPISISGALLTITVVVFSFILDISIFAKWMMVIALVFTVLAFIGTRLALPAVLSLRNAPEDEATLTETLNKFARWHSFSTIWQVLSFIALVAAIAGIR